MRPSDIEKTSLQNCKGKNAQAPRWPRPPPPPPPPPAGKEKKGKGRKGKERKGKEREGKESKERKRKGKDTKGRERERKRTKGEERKEKEHKNKNNTPISDRIGVVVAAPWITTHSLAAAAGGGLDGDQCVQVGLARSKKQGTRSKEQGAKKGGIKNEFSGGSGGRQPPSVNAGQCFRLGSKASEGGA